MNSLCTPKRNRISETSLDAFMRICLEEVCLKKDGTEKWITLKKKFFINPRKSLHENKVLTDGSS